MKKKAIALAVGALCIAPAAQGQIVFGNDKIGTVQLYGKLYPQLATFETKGATPVGGGVSNLVRNDGLLNNNGSNGFNHGRRFSVDTQNSYIGFRGERVIGGGLKAIWQVEQSVGLDGSGDVWSNRNSFVGLNGGFGTIKLGNMDTIYKEYGDTFSMLGISSGNFVSPSNFLSHIGVGNGGAARFHERRANSIQYQTPEFVGIQAGIQYGPDEHGNDPADVDVDTGTVLRPRLKADLWSFGVKYDSKMFYVSVQHERHRNFFGGSLNVGNQVSNIPANALFPPVLDDAGDPVDGLFVGESRAFRTEELRSKDYATRLSAEFRFGEGHRIVGDIARMKWSETGQDRGTGTLPNIRFVSLEKTAWGIGWDAKWGAAWRTAIQFVSANKGKCQLTRTECNTNGLDGKMYNAGVSYNIDRQTLAYFIASHLKNGASARYDNWANGSINRGSDITQLALGISYTF